LLLTGIVTFDVSCVLIDDDLEVNVLLDDPITSDVFPVSSGVASIDDPPVPVSL
jgi:hypothetical protein